MKYLTEVEFDDEGVGIIGNDLIKAFEIQIQVSEYAGGDLKTSTFKRSFIDAENVAIELADMINLYITTPNRIEENESQNG